MEARLSVQAPARKLAWCLNLSPRYDRGTQGRRSDGFRPSAGRQNPAAVEVAGTKGVTSMLT